jgi:signal transduction histidine kinase
MAVRIARVGGVLNIDSRPGCTLLTVRLALSQPS